MCDVFFLGTALSTDSQISPRIDPNEGSPSWKPTGTARTKDGNKGVENCRTCSCILDVEKSVGARNLGRRELEGAILMAGAVNAAMLSRVRDRNFGFWSVDPAGSPSSIELLKFRDSSAGVGASACPVVVASPDAVVDFAVVLVAQKNCRMHLKSLTCPPAGLARSTPIRVLTARSNSIKLVPGAGSHRPITSSPLPSPFPQPAQRPP